MQRKTFLSPFLYPSHICFQPDFLFRTCATYCGWQQQQLHYVVYRTYVSPPYIEQTWVRAAGRRHREEGIKANRLLKGVEGGVGRAAALPPSLLINRITRYRTVVGGRGASWSVGMEEELFPFALSSPCSPLLSRSFPSQFVRSIPSSLPSRPDAPNYIYRELHPSQTEERDGCALLIITNYCRRR